jgi:hypothetical protein
MGAARRTGAAATLAWVVAATLLVGAGVATAGDDAIRSNDDRSGTGGHEAAVLSPGRRGAYFGAYLPPKEWTVESQKNAVVKVEHDLGRRLDISNHYYWFTKPLVGWREAWDLEKGRIPLISWDGTYASRVLSGDKDPVIGQMADDVRALGGTVFLRYFWEMDGRKKAHMAESPKKYIAAWRHVHDVFAQRGTTNVAWVWCPNAYAFWTRDAMRWYPGNHYVDWACADGYNWGGRHGWRGFGKIFGSFYRAFKGRKPMMIGETGAVERGGNKAGWIRNTATTLKRDFPKVRAFVWFNSVDGAYDWRINTTRRSYRSYRDMARMSWFNP